MNNRRHTGLPETRRERSRLDRAVRRAVGMRFATPSMRSLLRACAVYANVIALVVALGMPNGNLRQAAGSAMSAFESAVRSANEAVFSGPDMLSAPVDLSLVTEPGIESSVSDIEPDAAPVSDSVFESQDFVRSGHDPRDSHGPADAVTSAE